LGREGLLSIHKIEKKTVNIKTSPTFTRTVRGLVFDLREK